MKRVSSSTESLNILFVKWLEEWKNEAIRKNKPTVKCFDKAISSLKKYPLEINNARECLIIQHINQKICTMLDKKLTEYRRQHNFPSDSAQNDFIDNEILGGKKMKTISNINQSQLAEPETLYNPTVNSPEYLILIILFAFLKKRDFMYKAEIAFKAQKIYKILNNKTVNFSSGKYWCHATTLNEHKLIAMSGSLCKYSLTKKGINVAKKLYEECENKSLFHDTDTKLSNGSENTDVILNTNSSPNLRHTSVRHSSGSKSSDDISFPKMEEVMIIDDDDDDKIFTSDTVNKNTNDPKIIKDIQPVHNIMKQKTDDLQKVKEQSNKNKKTVNQKMKTSSEDAPFELFYLLPNNFDIILLVDTQETSGSKTKPKDDATISELSKSGILFEVRNLKVGDFTWIARCRFTNRELVLPYIVERKRIDDLNSSIKDGRYHEQKFRLKQSGIKNICYLIENYGKNYHGSIPLNSLYQAAINSLVQDKFNVKFTRDHRDSMRFLATTTSMLIKHYEGKELKSCEKKNVDLNNSDIRQTHEELMEFGEFNKAAAKTKKFNVREMFMRQLLQLRGLSVDKALAITKLYPTPKVLAEAFRNADDKLLENIIYVANSTERKIGPVISKTLYQMYTKHTFN